MKRSSPFRFVSSNRRFEYSVWRGDARIGFVTKIVHRTSDRGVTKTIVSGWTPRTLSGPSTLSGIDLARQPTREAAARSLWSFHQASQS